MTHDANPPLGKDMFDQMNFARANQEKLDAELLKRRRAESRDAIVAQQARQDGRYPPPCFWGGYAQWHTRG